MHYFYHFQSRKVHTDVCTEANGRLEILGEHATVEDAIAEVQSRHPTHTVIKCPACLPE